MLTGSTNSRTPFDSNTWSASPPLSSIMRPYWNPEQPPPCTNTRRPLPAFPSSTSRSLIFDAADGDTLIIWKLYAPATAPAKAFRLKPVRYSFGNQHLTGRAHQATDAPIAA